MTSIEQKIPAPLRRPVVWVPLAIGLAYAVALFYASRIFAPCDDTFIYLVYVKNALAGTGLTFNGDRVQGFTSVLWTTMIWLLGAAGVALPRAANALSGASGLLLLFAAYFLGRQVGLPRGRSFIAPVLLVTAGDVAFYMSNGLETIFFAAALTFAIALAAGERDRSMLLPGALAVAVLTRPEGALVVVAAGVLLYLRHRTWRPVLMLAGIVALAVAPVIVAMKAYYGDWLPNTYYAKGGAGVTNLAQGLQYFANFLSWAFVFCLPVALLVMTRWRTMGASVRWLTVLLLVWLAYVTTQGGDNMVGFRAFVPILPLLFVLVALASTRLGPRVVAIAVVLTALYQVTIYNHGNLYGSSWNVDVRTQADNWARYYHYRVMISEHLLQTLPPNAVIAVNAAGTIPYYTGFTTIDMLGLNNKQIARNGKRDRSMPYGHQAYDGEYVVSQRPDVILFGGAGSVTADRFVGDVEISGLNDFKRLYRAKSMPGSFHGQFYDGRGAQDPQRELMRRKIQGAVKED